MSSEHFVTIPPRHTARLTPAQLEEDLQCAYIDTDFDRNTPPTQTLVSLRIGASFSNLALQGHRAKLIKPEIDESLCETVDSLIKNGEDAVYSFKLYLSDDQLEEELTIDFGGKLVLTSSVSAPLFK